MTVVEIEIGHAVRLHEGALRETSAAVQRKGCMVRETSAEIEWESRAYLQRRGCSCAEIA